MEIQQAIENRELKSCVCCGVNAAHTERNIDIEKSYVICSRCLYRTLYCDTTEEAIAVWNTRAEQHQCECKCGADKCGDDRWIKCSDQMPEEHEESQDVYHPDTLGFLDIKYFMTSDLVIVAVKNHDNEERFVADDITIDGKWYNYYGDFEVTHWMPLPKLPKEKSQ